MRRKIIGVAITRIKGKGRAMAAIKDFEAGEVVEKCPVLILTPKERRYCEKTILNHYIYPWKSTRSAAMVLGFGSIYNHSFNPNADWKQNFRDHTMVYKAIKPIKKGEEITVNYNGEPDNNSPIDWFDVK